MAIVQKEDIRGLNLEELTEYLLQNGESRFRAKQIYQWLWIKGAYDFDAMSNLSKSLRERLNTAFVINAAKVGFVQKSNDGTIKTAFKLYDGNLVEGVLIPTEDRVTACISSQVGCSLNCRFCATGYLDRKRNVEAAEIYDQVFLLNKLADEHYGRGLTNIVFMGMGEPLLNYGNVKKAIHFITGEEGMGMSYKRITLSTVGIAKMIRKLADENIKVNLAISLHAPTDEQRNKIMPINKQISISDLMADLKYFYSRTGKRITYEYTLIKSINDSLTDAKNLAKLCGEFPVKINIIEYNPIDNASYERSDEKTLNAFVASLASRKITISVRQSRGRDIDAACGQLANKQS